jgi:hypothetical protein
MGVWTKIPIPPPTSLRFRLKDVDRLESRKIKTRQVLTFHAVGCTGYHADQQFTAKVAAAMAVQVAHPHRYGGTPAVAPASFLYHLGDVVYKKDKDTAADQSPPPEHHHDFAELYDRQFYAPYAAYQPPIFAVPGNHDGKDRDPTGPLRKSAIHHFLKNFCGLEDGDLPDNQTSDRPPMMQPYPYWLLRTPLAYFIGLYTNVNNAGQLDNPEEDDQPQYQWLVRTLQDIRKAEDERVVFLVVHYPPYSAAVNFRERGNPNLGPTPRPPHKTLEPLGNLLQQAFRESRRWPDIVLSAHAHLYQRLTYTCADGRQIPYLIAGSGGHGPVERLTRPCGRNQSGGPADQPPAVVFPPGLSLPADDRVDVAAFNDQDFGFLRITVDGTKRRLIGEFFRVSGSSNSSGPLPGVVDSFTLDLRSHILR